ncbi:hypothetical protein PFISCL1PPCAC_26796, partial [Pristionchus fissidentatus]
MRSRMMRNVGPLVFPNWLIGFSVQSESPPGTAQFPPASLGQNVRSLDVAVAVILQQLQPLVESAIAAAEIRSIPQQMRRLVSGEGGDECEKERPEVHDDVKLPREER